MIKVKKGQALILILLVIAVSLTLGVSVASRSITTLKQVSFSAQSAQALAFAEGGIEEALKCLDDGSCAVPSDPAATDLTGDGTNDFDYRITALGGAVLDSFPPLSRDEAIELSLSGYPSSTPMYISWVNTAKPSEVADPAAVEFAAIYQEAGVYKVLRYAYDPDASRASENGFFTPFTGGFSVNGVTYAYRVSISVPFTPIALRIPVGPCRPPVHGSNQPALRDRSSARSKSCGPTPPSRNYLISRSSPDLKQVPYPNNFHLLEFPRAVLA